MEAYQPKAWGDQVDPEDVFEHFGCPRFGRESRAYRFIAWCIEDHFSEPIPMTKEVFDAYFHAAHVYQEEGPLT
jgi:hypothetical protein